MKTLTRTSLLATATAGLLWAATGTSTGCDSGSSNNNTDMPQSSTDMPTGGADMGPVGSPAFAKLTAGFRQPFGTVYDPTTSAWYVSNVDGMPSDPKSLKDGKAFITKIPFTGGQPGTPDHTWFTTGINAPTGIKVASNKLYFADVDQLVVVDIAAKTAVRSATLAASGQAQLLGLPSFMLDVTVTADGTAYAIDATGGRIVRFGTPMTAGNTGLLVGNEGDYHGPASIYHDATANKLVIVEAGINQIITYPGGVTTVDLTGMNKKDLVTTTQNNLAFAGCEKDGSDYLIGSPADKMIYRVNATSGQKTAIQGVSGDGATGVNDFGFDSTNRIIAVPDAASNTVFFYKLP